MTDFYIDTTKIITNSISPEKIVIEPGDEGFGCILKQYCNNEDNKPGEIFMSREQALLVAQELLKMFSDGKEMSETVASDKLPLRG